MQAKRMNGHDTTAMVLQNLEMAEKMDAQSQIMVHMQDRVRRLCHLLEHLTYFRKQNTSAGTRRYSAKSLSRQKALPHAKQRVPL